MPAIHPYIARSDAEYVVKRDLVIRGGLLAYIDERPDDRDAHGVLWQRQIMAPLGQGAPRFGQIQTARQRHAILNLLCQVCGGEPDEDDDGILWLLPRRPEEGPARMIRPRFVCYPPICHECCLTALRLCPPLRAGHTVLRVQGVAPAGVIGRLYDANCQPVTGEDEWLLYGDPRLSMLMAGQQTIGLTDYRIMRAPPAPRRRPG
jgi:hypothetical protein